MTVLFVQAVNDSRTLTYIVESKKHQSQNEYTSISKHPSQTDAFLMKSPSEKRENNFINIGT